MSSQTQRIKGNVSSIFTKPDTGTVTGVNTNNFTWGVGVGSSPPNSLRFSGVTFDTILDLGSGFSSSSDLPFQLAAVGYTYGTYQGRKLETKPFSLGTLSYFNGTTRSGTEANRVSLDITLDNITIEDSVGSPYTIQKTTFRNSLSLDSTTNIEGDREASADYVRFPSTFSDVSFKTSTDKPLTLKIDGFGKITGQGFTAQDGNQFRVYE
jgi:hypothetical protein